MSARTREYLYSRQADAQTVHDSSMDEAESCEKCCAWLETGGHRLLSVRQLVLELKPECQSPPQISGEDTVSPPRRCIKVLTRGTAGVKAQEDSLSSSDTFESVISEMSQSVDDAHRSENRVQHHQDDTNSEAVCCSCANAEDLMCTNITRTLEISAFTCDCTTFKRLQSDESLWSCENSSCCWSLENSMTEENLSRAQSFVCVKPGFSEPTLCAKSSDESGILHVDSNVRKSTSLLDRLPSDGRGLSDELVAGASAHLSCTQSQSDSCYVDARSSSETKSNLSCLGETLSHSAGSVCSGEEKEPSILGSDLTDSFTNEKPDIDVDKSVSTASSRIYVGKHAQQGSAESQVTLNDTVYFSLRDTASGSSLPDSPSLSLDRSDFRSCSSCSCVYPGDVQLGLHVASSTCALIDRWTRKQDYMYHIAPVALDSEEASYLAQAHAHLHSAGIEVWNLAQASENTQLMSAEQLTSTYHQVDMVYRTVAEITEVSIGDSLQWGHQPICAHAEVVPVGYGDSPTIPWPEVDISVELAQGPAFREQRPTTSTLVC